jgi:crossover junction endodeoxyribonuclease RusA
VKTELLIPYPPSVNHLFATKRGGGRVKTAAYRSWITEAGWMIQSQPDRLHRHTGKVSFTMLVRRPDSRRRDQSNLIKAVEDLLVRHGILIDDSLIEEIRVRWVYEGFEGAKVILEDLAL